MLASFQRVFEGRRGVILLLAAAVLPFLPALSGAFVYDDFPAILKNPSVRAADVRAVFASGSYWREEVVGYRPITTLSFIANLAVAGERPWAFHATNIALHAANALLVAAIARRVLRDAVAGSRGGMFAVLAALVFAVHPAQVESVAGIAAGRAELLSALFVLLAMLVSSEGAGASARSNGAPAWRAIGAAALYLAALLSKESALPLPAFVFLLAGDARRARGALGARAAETPAAAYRRHLLVRYGAFAVALAAYLAMRHAALGRVGGMLPAFLDNPLAHAPHSAFVPGVLRVASEYARLIIFPAALSADYGFDAVPLSSSILSLSALPGVLLVAALIAAPIRLRGGGGARALIALAIALAIPLHLVATLPALCAERFLYLPMAFVGFAVAAIVATAARGEERPSAGRSAERPLRSGSGFLAAGLAALVLLLGARSAVRAADWRSEIALFESSARAKPGSARLHNALGLAYANAGQQERAESEYRRALEIYPDYAAALVNLGNVELRRGDTAAARDRYVRALALDPGYIKARWNLAVALETLGDVNGAAREYAEIAARDATHFESRLRLGEILAAAGRGREAERALSEALALRPGDAAAARALASARAAGHER